MPKKKKGQRKGTAPRGHAAAQRVHPPRFACCTPQEHCNGRSNKECDRPIGRKTHSTPQEVIKCEEKYLQKHEGFKKVGQRMLEDPKTGYIRILSRARQRSYPGKEEKYMNAPLKILVW